MTREDWNKFMLSKLSKEETFKQECLELYKIYNAVQLFCKKIYANPNEQQNVFIAAMITFHKYRISSNLALNQSSSEDIYILLGACLFIGQRAINVLKINIENIAFFINQLINNKNQNNKLNINDLNKKIIQKEYDILTSIGFNIEIDSPYQFFCKLKYYFSKSEINSPNFVILLSYIIKDSLILPISLYYTPNIIAISCIKIIIEKYNINFINIKDLISLSDYDLDNKDIDECELLIQKIQATINEKKSMKNYNNSNNEEKGKEKDNISDKSKISPIPKEYSIK